MDILNNPLLLVAISALISAAITSAIETLITNRSKNKLEQRLEEVRHKHRLEIEQLRAADEIHIKETALLAHLDAEQVRIDIEQRLMKLPKAVEALFQTRFLALEIIDELSSGQETDLSEKETEFYEAVARLSHALFEVDNSEFRQKANMLLNHIARFAQQIGPMRQFILRKEASNRAYILEQLHDFYGQFKIIQTQMMDMIVNSTANTEAAPNTKSQ